MAHDSCLLNIRETWKDKNMATIHSDLVLDYLTDFYETHKEADIPKLKEEKCHFCGKRIFEAAGRVQFCVDSKEMEEFLRRTFPMAVCTVCHAYDEVFYWYGGHRPICRHCGKTELN